MTTQPQRYWKEILIALIAGVLFASGLILSGMHQPKKVLGFLDVFGAWDPSLAFVMLGAIAAAFPAFRWLRHRHTTLLHTPLHLPTQTIVNRRLVIGSALFGIGWGLVGICPGPAIVLLAQQILHVEIWMFFISMLIGMLIFEYFFTTKSTS